MSELKPCPFGKDHKVWIGVHDEEGNFHGEIGCEYESDAWSGLTYGLHHDGWGDCPLCTDGESETMGGMLFDSINAAAKAWGTRSSDHICSHCGETFPPTHPDQKYCSKECKTASYVNRALKSKEGLADGLYRALKNGKNGSKVVDL